MRAFIFLFCTVTFGFTTHNVLSQNAKIIIDADMTITVDEVFTMIKKQTDYRFIYKKDMFKGFPKVFVNKGVIKANVLLNKSLSKGGFVFNFLSKKNIVIKKKTQKSIDKTSQYYNYGSNKRRKWIGITRSKYFT